MDEWPTMRENKFNKHIFSFRLSRNASLAEELSEICDTGLPFKISSTFCLEFLHPIRGEFLSNVHPSILLEIDALYVFINKFK